MCVGELKHLLKEEELLNKNQCSNLCKNIDCVMKVFGYLISCSNDASQYELLLSELFLVLKKVFSLVKSCAQPIFSKAVIFQMKNKESFRQLLWNLKYCCDIASDMLLKYNFKNVKTTRWLLFI